MQTINKLYSEWQSLQPLTPENQKRLNDKFNLEFNFNSNHIEGNTLTYGQTKLLLLFGKIESEEGTPFRDFEEMKAHAAGLRWIKELAQDKEHIISEHEIKQLNHIILAEDFYKADNNGNRYKVHVGQYKTRPNSVITVTGEEFTYASPEETPAMMNDLVNWLSSEIRKAEITPIELAALFHYRYIRIHPFEDGNGRIARLLVTYILERSAYPMLIIKSTDKTKYLNALNRADANVGLTPNDGATATLEQIVPFTDYMKQQLQWSLNIAIAAAKGESIEEDEDWKKRLTLKLGNKKGAPRRTDELAEIVYKNVYKSLLEHIHDEIEQFFPLFSNVRYMFDEDSNKKYLFYFEKRYSKSLILEIKLIEQGYVYIIQSNWVNLDIYVVISMHEKRYDEILSDDEMKDIINSIGKAILKYYGK